MLNLRLVRGPLPRAQNEAILGEYNRLTSARIPIEEFEHWVQRSPAGPAWHALLETDEGRIVGHTCLFPLHIYNPDANLIPAKSEYSVLLEDCRRMKVRGFEKAALPAFIILLDQLFRHCLAEGWGPLFASTNKKNQVFTRKIGLRPLEFRVQECLLILNPVGAARETPNIDSRRRAVLFVAGLGQRFAWSVALAVLSRRNGIHSGPASASPITPVLDRLSFFEDVDSLGWRYLDGQYVRLAPDSSSGDYLIAKRGGPDRYVRVCQWRLSNPRLAPSLVRELVRQGETDRAIGVRWAIYEDGPDSGKLLRQMKSLGFVCAPRVRIVMVHKTSPKFLSTNAWTMNDSLFSFDP